MLTIYMDTEIDAVGIEFDDSPAGYSKRLDDYRSVDYSINPGSPIGVSLHNVNEGVKIEGLPQPERIRSILHGLGVRTV